LYNFPKLYQKIRSRG